MDARKSNKRQFGSLKDQINIDDKFFDPLPEKELRFWECKEHSTGSSKSYELSRSSTS